MEETTYQVVQDFFQQQYQQKFGEETISRSDLYIPSLPIIRLIRPYHALPTLSTLPYRNIYPILTKIQKKLNESHHFSQKSRANMCFLNLNETDIHSSPGLQETAPVQ